MKATSQTTSPIPKPARFALYLGAVALLSIFNWVALPAQNPARSLEDHLANLQIVEVEAEIKLENWMLTFTDDLLTTAEPEIGLEPWMLASPDPFVADKEPEMEIEPWMISFTGELLASSETDLKVEEWMTNTLLWETACILAKK